MMRGLTGALLGMGLNPKIMLMMSKRNPVKVSQILEINAKRKVRGILNYLSFMILL